MKATNNNIGVIVDSTGYNQSAFIGINAINTLSLGNSKYKCSLFYKNLSYSCTKLASTSTTLDKIYHYHGTLIATNLDLAAYMIKAYAPKTRILYLFELEWAKENYNMDYVKYFNILNNRDIKIVAPSQFYADAIKNFCGRKVDAVIPQFNITEIMNELCPTESV